MPNLHKLLKSDNFYLYGTPTNINESYNSRISNLQPLKINCAIEICDYFLCEIYRREKISKYINKYDICNIYGIHNICCTYCMVYYSFLLHVTV